MGAIDLLTCGGCRMEFPLSSIVRFMEHKKSGCNTSSSPTLVTGTSSAVLLSAAFAGV